MLPHPPRSPALRTDLPPGAGGRFLRWSVMVPTGSLGVPLTRADQGLLWGSSGLQNRRDQDFPTESRILGGNGRRRGVVTRISESKRRRQESKAGARRYAPRAAMSPSKSLSAMCLDKVKGLPVENEYQL